MPSRSARLLLAAAIAAVLAGCGGGAVDVTRAPVSLSGQTRAERITLPALTLIADVPVELDEPRPHDRTEEDCPASRITFGTIPTGRDDHDPKLFFGSTSRPCPDRPGQNGAFPTWDSVDDLPSYSQELPVDAPLQSAYRFSVDYMQCTNECYGRTYDVVFITLAGSDQTFWVQSTDLDTDVVDKIIDSLRLG